MTENDLNPDILSAYVDGELEPEEASRVARLIASDEAVARRAAKLSEMKAAVAGMAPEIVVVTVPRPRPASRWMLSFAAGACASLLVFAVAWFGLARGSGGGAGGTAGGRGGSRCRAGACGLGRRFFHAANASGLRTR